MDKLLLTFGNSPAANSNVDAAIMNALVGKINELVIAQNANETLLNQIQKSELLVHAIKFTTSLFNADGQAITVTGWTTKLNKDSIFNATSGICTIKLKGTYTTVSKVLVSADNLVSPRSKLVAVCGGEEIDLDEDNSFSTTNQNISNYRVTHSVDGTSQLNPGQTILINCAVWGGTQARIFGNNFTSIKIYREL